MYPKLSRGGGDKKPASRFSTSTRRTSSAQETGGNSECFKLLSPYAKCPRMFMFRSMKEGLGDEEEASDDEFGNNSLKPDLGNFSYPKAGSSPPPQIERVLSLPNKSSPTFTIEWWILILMEYSIMEL